MGDLKTQNTSYPASLDTATVIADSTDTAVAANINGPASAVVAIETELGVTPKGTSASVAARLNTNIHGDGGLLRGSVFPSTPPNVPHYFYKTDETKLYIYNTGTASYDAVTTAVALAAYIQKDVPTTITAIHTLNPASTSAPLIIGANGAGQKVTGLNADMVDGLHATSANTVTTAVARDSSGNFAAGTITANLTGNATGLVSPSGTKWVEIANGNTGSMSAHTPFTLILRASYAHHIYVFSVYSTDISCSQGYSTTGPYGMILQSYNVNGDILYIYNESAAGHTYYYKVWVWE
jgi:hypothetical protein